MIKNNLLTILRDTHTSRSAFRQATEQLSYILAGECGDYLDRSVISVTTPLAETTGEMFSKDLVMVPILRAGLAMLPQFLKFYPHSAIGFFGMRRDEITKHPHLYYHNLPNINESQNIIVLDPMIATGGSAVLALEKLIQLGASEEKIICSGIIAAPEGLERLRKQFPKIKVVVAVIDAKLNHDAFIVPGLGDFGDRFFGT
jgi:uracil phosphoribosyltransferase